MWVLIVMAAGGQLTMTVPSLEGCHQQVRYMQATQTVTKAVCRKDGDEVVLIGPDR